MAIRWREPLSRLRFPLRASLAGQSTAIAGTVSIGLRGFVLIAKFAFIVVLAKFTTPATVGIYALLVTIVTVAIYAIGLEIHTFTAREIVSDEGVASADSSMHVQNHIVTIFGVYLLGLPFVWAVVSWLGLGSKFHFFLFAAVLFNECLSQELGRYLLVISRPVASNFLQFIRGGVWMPFPIAVIASEKATNDINIILWGWLFGSLFACLFGLWCVRSYFMPWQRFRLAWLGEAFFSARFYFAVALLTQVQYYSDRFIVQLYMGEASVGVLSFYQSFANTMVAFVQTGVISVMLPRLLLAAKRNDLEAERKVRRSIFLWAMVLALGISLALGVGMPFVLQQMDRSSYTTALPIFYVLLVGNLILIASLVVHLSLYARRCDSQLLYVSLVVIPIGLAANLIAVPYLGILGAVGVFTATACLDLGVKYWLLRRLKRQLG